MNPPGDLPRLSGLPEALAFLRDGDDFVLTAHVNADADAIGSCLALRRALVGLGKKARVALVDKAPHYAFMQDFAQILPPEAVGPCARAVVLDCPSLERAGAVGEVLAHLPRLNMDHHPDNALFGDANLVDTGVSSTCELVYHLVLALEAPLDLGTAELLYTGILFDTGGFRYSLATPVTFEVAGDLVRRGVRLQWVADRLFGDKALDDLKVLGSALDSLELHLDGRVAVLYLGPDDLRRGDAEEVVNYGLAIEGTLVSVLLKEEESGKFRLSLRSREPVDVGRVAALFGGGGHTLAAGARAEGTPEEVRENLLAELQKAMR